MAKRGPVRRRLKRTGDRLVAGALLGLVDLVSRLPPDRALGTAHAIGRRLGPLSARHRVVTENLARAMPELGEGERDRIARESWGHQARLVVETAQLERLFDWSPAPDAAPGRVEIDDPAGALDAHRAGTAAKDAPPLLFFTGHTGCFEMLPRMAAAAGLDMAVLFRPPNNRPLAERLMERRARTGARFLASRRGAAAALHAHLSGGGAVGLLVDQKFARGPRVPFMGVEAATNPLVVKLAAITGRVVLPARCVRLPGNRYRVAIEPPLALPADETAALALVNARVEAWVREHPEQWMWFHRRWA